MTHRLFGGVLFSLAIALAASPLLLVDADGGASVAAGAPAAAAIAPAVDVPPDAAAVLANDDEMPPALIADLDLIRICDGYAGACEPEVVCFLTDLVLTHWVDSDRIEYQISGATNCENGRLEFEPIVGTDEIPGSPPTIRNVTTGDFTLNGFLAPEVCGLGSTLQFRVTYVRAGEDFALGRTATAPLAICGI